MKCDDKDLLQFLEGNAGEEAMAHIRECAACSVTVRELSLYRRVLPSYRDGTKLLKKLDDHVKSFDGGEVRHLPTRIEEMLREAGKEEAAELGGKVKPFRRPEKESWKAARDSSGSEPLARAAVPRDITRPKKDKEKGHGDAKKEK
jgi:hypothetical protein